MFNIDYYDYTTTTSSLDSAYWHLYPHTYLIMRPYFTSIALRYPVLLVAFTQSRIIIVVQASSVSQTVSVALQVSSLSYIRDQNGPD